MQIQDVYSLIDDDRRAVDEVIKHRLYSEVELINQVGHYIVNSGGKRLRPMLVLLSARAFGYEGTCHHELAAVVEFIHTATLLHDDVVDGSEMRRGQDTANAVWGNEAAVLVGDFLYSRSFEMMVNVGDMRVMEILAEATRTIAEGEVKQLLNVHNAEATESEYLDVICSKTAKLFESAAELGAVISGRKEAAEAMAAYGLHLGVAYQLVDDALDYSAASSEQLGKNIGDDLAEGKPTLPLIYALEHGTAQQAAVIREAIENGGKELIESVKEAIESTGAIAYTSRSAKREAEKAMQSLAVLPDSPYRDAMIFLARFAVERTY
ncbi:polyprenyl synthetase family protein [Thiohalomonas denitrificans]|uniref:Octaprenyl diphosphate synthase n=1 Tax=Thiohalomonas denitrificans TaxID=415747 RepID=A0A1G5PPW8_9GAMM|nr:polyprenyl synthetase family protein [Thiohalomonas denitrificans]SCZ51675.1 octaprenyl-diphosphate synthase [Thiohalomonas denitrificans]